METKTLKIPPKKEIFSLCIAIILVFFLLRPSFGQPHPKLKVMASLFPLQEFASAVGGDRVQATLLLPPGAEAHTWEPRPSDVAKIAQADIFIYIGPSMEPWVDKVLQAAKGKRLLVVEVSRGIPLLRAEQGEEGRIRSGRGRSFPEKIDPHIWLDFSLDLRILDAIANAFSEKDPAQASLYKNNAGIYGAKLKDLDKKYHESLAKCRFRQILLSGHAAFAYLAKRYDLQQIPLSGISPDAEPTPKKMAEVIEATRKSGIHFIYAEELVNPKLTQALAKEAGVGILTLNPGHNLTPEQVRQKMTFLRLMEKNLQNLQQGLECGKE
jgi:zinc transport system substrate-binding protein